MPAQKSVEKGGHKLNKKFMFKDGNGELRVFYDQKPDVDCPIFEWSNGSYGRHKIHNSKWHLENSFVMNPILIDPLGEAHSIDGGDYHDAVNFSSWKEYLTDKKIKELERKIESLNYFNEKDNKKLNSIYQTINDVMALMVKGHKGIGYNEHYRNAYLLLRSII